MVKLINKIAAQNAIEFISFHPLCLFHQFFRSRIAHFKIIKFQSNCGSLWKWVGLNDTQIVNPEVHPSNYNENEKWIIFCLKGHSYLKLSYFLVKKCISCGNCNVTNDTAYFFLIFTIIHWFLNAFENLGNPQEIPRNPENLVILGDFENLVRYFEKWN